MIYQDSRYETADVVRLQKNGKTRLTVVPQPAGVLVVVDYAYHRVIEGERIDILATQYLGDPELWWVIAEANPQWSFYDRLPVGTLLRIPSGIRSR